MKFFLTQAHPCNYLPGRVTVDLVLDPDTPWEWEQYSELADLGFRRSGQRVYRPHCSTCQACLSLRVDVENFKPRRIHRRVWARNQDLRVHEVAVPTAEHFELYRRYQHHRHPGGQMARGGMDEFLEFVTGPGTNMRYFEFRLDTHLLAVAVSDVLRHGLSAMYTFYDPHHAPRSLGVYAVLWQIAAARRRDLEWLYLGYWIAASPKMAYKNQYRPAQIYSQGVWRWLVEAENRRPDSG